MAVPQRPAEPNSIARQEARFGAAFLRKHGWRLALLFAGVLLPLWGFVELADELREAEAFPFDAPILQLAHAMARDGFDQLFLLFSALGYEYGVVPFDIALVVALAWRRRFRESIFAAAALGGSALLNIAAKQAFARDRPSLWESISPEDSFSFPSGHAMGSMTLAVVLVLLALPTRWRWSAIVRDGGVRADGRPVAHLSRRALPVRHPCRMGCGFGVGGGVLRTGVLRASAAVADAESRLGRFFRKLLGSLRHDDSGQHARRPDVHGLRKIERLVQRTALYADGVGGTTPLMPEPGTTVWTERAVERMAAVGRTRPELRLSLRQAQCGVRHDERNAEGGGRLLPALFAMTDVQLRGAAGKRITDRPALATTE